MPLTDKDPHHMTFGEAIQAMSEAAVQQHYWDALGDSNHAFAQQAAWRKRTDKIRERLTSLWETLVGVTP